MGQVLRVENKDPLDLRAFNIQKAVPLIVKRIEVSRVHIPDWDMVNLFMMKGEVGLGLFEVKFSLFLF